MFKAIILSLSSIAGCAPIVAHEGTPKCEVWVTYGEYVPNVSPPCSLNFTEVSRMECDHMGGKYYPGDVCKGVDY